MHVFVRDCPRSASTLVQPVAAVRRSAETVDALKGKRMRFTCAGLRETDEHTQKRHVHVGKACEKSILGCFFLKQDHNFEVLMFYNVRHVK